MSSNYPPGMKESDIPGFGDHETQVKVECGTKDVMISVLRDPGEILDSLYRATAVLVKVVAGSEAPAGRITYPKQVEQRLNTVLRLFKDDTAKVVVDQCPFQGYIEVLVDGSPQEFEWECPLCGSIHTGYFPGYDDDY